MGGGTTDVAIYTAGAVVHTYVLPIGGAHITSDIAYGLRAPIKVAEMIKRNHGCAMVDLVESNEVFQVPHVGGERVHNTSRRMLAEVIEPRLQETFELVLAELRRTGYEDMLPAGIVLTGGATSLPGMIELAERVFGMPARRGIPRDIGGLSDVVSSPAYSTSVGLVKWGMAHWRSECRWDTEPEGLVTKMRNRVTTWLGLAF
jgi:cell division protein FtsA